MTKPVYVDNGDPVATVEAFISDFNIDEDFRPLARMLRRFARRLENDAALTAAVPTAFASGNWSLVDLTDGSGFNLVISALPAANGSALVSIQYRVDDGEWVTIPSATGTTAVEADLGERDVYLRIRNSIGYSTEDTKSVTVTEV